MKNQTVIPFSGLRRALSSLAIGACLLLGQALGQAQVAKVGDALLRILKLLTVKRVNR